MGLVAPGQIQKSIEHKYAIKRAVRLDERPAVVSHTERVGLNKQLAATIDPLLQTLLPAAVDDHAVLSELIAVHATPVIENIIRYKLHLRAGSADADDLRQEAVAHLLGELRKFRHEPNSHPIGDFRALTAVIAYRTCSGWMRRQFPERHALKTQIQYVLTRHRGFALWQDRNDKWVAGFEEWKNQTLDSPIENIDLDRDDEWIAQVRSLNVGLRQTALPTALITIFNHLKRPVYLDKLVAALAALSPIAREPMLSSRGGDAGQLKSGMTSDPSWKTEKRIFLERLWDELRQLPRQQRVALLLNLKDAHTVDCILLFPATGIASFRQLAEALEISIETFAELWNEMPLEDAKIAELLHVTRQQVINLRKSARERLARRLRGFI